VQKSFGNTSVIRDVNLTVMKGERHALIGPNGAGKTTLFNLISGYMKPTAGSILLKAFWKNIDNLPEVRERTAQILQDINLTSRRDVPAGLLAYAEQRTLEIGITIAGGADVILLDEPTAGMSRAETERAVALIRHLTNGRTLLIIEHDMSVVFGLADHISVLVYGQIIASGTPEEIRGNPKVKEAYLGEEAA
jgi:branched-chain amino acid transport system ATP-binding protein